MPYCFLSSASVASITVEHADGSLSGNSVSNLNRAATLTLCESEETTVPYTDVGKVTYSTYLPNDKP